MMTFSEYIAPRYYHGSRREFPVGFILRPRSDGYVAWHEVQKLEKLIESVRPKDKIPRLESVFMVTDPEEIDYAGGYEDYIYEVEPIGKVEKSDLSWYSKAEEYILNDLEKAKYCAERYWAGISFEDPTNSLFEYRCRSAKIIRVHSMLENAIQVPVFYHGTLRKNLPAIMKRGLKLGEGWGGAGTTGVYLSATRDGALYWAKLAHQRETGGKLEIDRFDRQHGPRQDKLLAVVEVHIPPDKIGNLGADMEQAEDVGFEGDAGDWESSIREIGDVVYHGTIPPAWLKVI